MQLFGIVMESKAPEQIKTMIILSSWLFILLFNDLDDYFYGGIIVRRIIIKLLAYADDVILLSSDRFFLVEYCSNWNLEVNLDKSKDYIKGGKHANMKNSGSKTHSSK